MSGLWVSVKMHFCAQKWRTTVQPTWLNQKTKNIKDCVCNQKTFKHNANHAQLFDLKQVFYSSFKCVFQLNNVLSFSMSNICSSYENIVEPWLQISNRSEIVVPADRFGFELISFVFGFLHHIFVSALKCRKIIFANTPSEHWLLVAQLHSNREIEIAYVRR